MKKSEKIMERIKNLERIELSNNVSKVKSDLFNSVSKVKTEEDFSRKRTETMSSINSDLSTIKSNKSNFSSKTVQSKPFNKELDLDLPEFTSTKYASPCWKVPHSAFYFLFSGTLFGANICFISTENYYTYNIISLVAHNCYFISSFFEWFYFRRGCIGAANLNSKVKDNIDYSLRARILRSEQGWKYFFSILGSIVLIFGNIHYFIYNNKNNEEKIKKGIIPDKDYWNINLAGIMIISLAQILKINKILVQTRQYMIQNDLANCLIEIFFYFASLSFGTIYYFNLLYDYDYEKYKIFYKITRMGGSVLTVLSSICLINRYYLSNYDDLNTSDLSNITL